MLDSINKYFTHKYQGGILQWQKKKEYPTWYNTSIWLQRKYKNEKLNLQSENCQTMAPLLLRYFELEQTVEMLWCEISQWCLQINKSQELSIVKMKNMQLGMLKIDHCVN